MAAASRDLPILIAGGGIAGLTAALALAAEGLEVRLYEQSHQFQEVGAGLQLSPNATHTLRRLGVLDRLMPQASRPLCVSLSDATSLRRLTEIPLGAEGERRWGAPYLVAHRAAIQQALLDAVSEMPAITLITGAAMSDAVLGAGDVTLATTRNGIVETTDGALLVGADGVWSSARHLIDPHAESAFSGMTAWRTTLDVSMAETLGLPAVTPLDRVSTFLDPAAHLIAYPIAGAGALNLVAITRGGPADRRWSATDSRAPLDAFLNRLPSPLRSLAGLPDWTRWPLHTAPQPLKWTGHRLALIGDAAHAMMPFAAQGAAMGIEDGAVLAARLATRGAIANALSIWEQERRQRVDRVLKRARLNRMAWHAAGPVAMARDLVFRMKGPARLAADLDWLYGWKEPRQR